MQISIEQDTLNKAIGQVLGVVDKRSTMPILSHCLLQTDGAGVFVSATDLEISFRGFYPAEVKEPGALSVQAEFFSKLIKDLPKGPLALVGTNKDRLKIQAGDSLYELHGLPGSQFPDLQEVAGANRVEIGGPLLKEMISKTIFSAVGNLAGILWEDVEVDEKSGLRLASTDGHRLTLIDRPLPEDRQLGLSKGIMVPYKGMREICRFVDGQKKVTLGIDEKTLTVRAANKHLSVRLLDHKFPDYRRIIQESFAYRFSINRRELSDILNCMAQLSTDRIKGVIFNLKADSLEVAFDDPEVGEGRDMVPVNLESGDPSKLPLEVGFNIHYFMEPLQVMVDDTVFLEIDDAIRPCRLMGNDPHYFGLVMPMSR